MALNLFKIGFRSICDVLSEQWIPTLTQMLELSGDEPQENVYKIRRIEQKIKRHIKWQNKLNLPNACKKKKKLIYFKGFEPSDEKNSIHSLKRITCDVDNRFPSTQE